MGEIDTDTNTDMDACARCGGLLDPERDHHVALSRTSMNPPERVEGDRRTSVLPRLYRLVHRHRFADEPRPRPAERPRLVAYSVIVWDSLTTLLPSSLARSVTSSVLPTGNWKRSHPDPL